MTDSIVDISGIETIQHIHDKSLFKKWTKLIPKNKTIILSEYGRKDYFIPIADVILDTEVFMSGKKEKYSYSIYSNYIE